MGALNDTVAQLQASIKRIETIKKKIQATIMSLPENDAVTPIGSGTPRCFTIKSSELFRTGMWSASYHCFQTQYAAISRLIDRARPEHVIGLLLDVVARKSIKVDGERMHIHPQVAEHLRSLI